MDRENQIKLKHHFAPKEWYCYICGNKKLLNKFYLWSMNDSTDRIFIACSKNCLNVIDSTKDFPTYSLKIRQENKVKES